MPVLIISDACSLILLEKIHLLDKLAENKMSFIIPKEVYKEAIEIGIKNKYPDAFRLKEKVDTCIIKIKEVKDSKKVKQLQKDFNIGKGEAEAIALFQEIKACLLASDDRLATNACNALRIPVSGTLSFVTESFCKKIISECEAKEMIELLAKEGRYKDELIFNALHFIEEK